MNYYIKNYDAKTARPDRADPKLTEVAVHELLQELRTIMPRHLQERCQW